MIKQDISENQVKTVFLGIGSNLGNRNRNIELSKFKLYLENIEIIKCSSNYETPSWPNPKRLETPKIKEKYQRFDQSTFK